MLAKNSGEFVFTLENGDALNDAAFRRIWKRASFKAGVEYRKPYTTRHTFVAWARVLNIHPDTVVVLMGHNSRKMVDEVYGKPLRGLNKDYDKILGFFGKDFLEV